MNEFEVFKEISLFLRKVLFKLWHSNKSSNQQVPEENLDKEDKEALENLISLLDENVGSDSEGETSQPIRRNANLRFRSTKMPTLSKHKWLKVFLDLVQKDLGKVNWVGPNNLTNV